MAKCHTSIGFSIDDYEDPDRPGYWGPSIVERKYYVDVLRDTRKWAQGSSVNGELTINNEFSIVSDAYARDNLGHFLYIEYLGVKWAITNVELEYPRVKITVGGIYNGPEREDPTFPFS